MRRPRIYTEQPLASGTELALDPRAARHLGQVLRLRQGDELLLFNGDGRDWPARLLTLRKRELRVAVGAPGPEEPSPLLQIHLGLGISRGERMDLAIQKSVELGVGRITPLETMRSVVRIDAGRMQKRLRHWQGVIVAACEQCGRRRLPELAPRSSLQQWLAIERKQGLLLDQRATHTLNQLPPPDGEIHLLVGPEGGLTPEERSAAETAGFIPVRLGPRVLRTETAPLAAIAAMQALWGDFAQPASG